MSWIRNTAAPDAYNFINGLKIYAEKSHVRVGLKPEL
jgi:hypothetical protein